MAAMNIMIMMMIMILITDLGFFGLPDDDHDTIIMFILIFKIILTTMHYAAIL